MPSTVTHAFLGIDTLKKLNKKPKKIIEERLDNFKIYCQNMDVLYFYHIFLLKENKIQKLGHRFHLENVYNYFEQLINDNKDNQDLELFTFISGLIIHYQADSIMHPFIDYVSHKHFKRDGHFIIETYLDNYFINKYVTSNYQKHNHTKLLFNYTEEKIIKEEIEKISKLFFNYQDMGKKYYRALAEMKFVYQHVRYDKLGIKKKIYSFIDLNPLPIRRVKFLSYHFPLDMDDVILNLNHNNWINESTNISSNKSYLDLYEEVTQKASFIINELYGYIFENKIIDLKKLIGNNSYSSGLPLN